MLCVDIDTQTLPDAVYLPTEPRGHACVYINPEVLGCGLCRALNKAEPKSGLWAAGSGQRECEALNREAPRPAVTNCVYWDVCCRAD